MRKSFRQRLCLSGYFEDIESNQDLFDLFELIEIRCDNMTDFTSLLNFEDRHKLIFTYKEQTQSELDMPDSLLDKLNKLISLNPAFVDIPFSPDIEKIKTLIEFAKVNSVGTILSLHITDDSIDLLKQYKQTAQELNPDLFKIVFPNNSSVTSEAIENLYSVFPIGRFICFVSGDSRKESRLVALDLGAPFTFVSSSRFRPTGEGQYCFEELMNDSMMFD